MVCVSRIARRIIIAALPAIGLAPVGAARDASTPLPTCGVERGTLTGNRVGAIRIGMPADSVKIVCHLVRDTLESAEGDLYRVLVVLAADDTLRAGIWHDRVRSVILRSARFSTADSLHVGISLARLRTYPGMEGADGEGEYFVYDETDPRTCGLSFRLDLGPRGLGSIPSGLVRALPAAASKLVVDEILVRGCQK